MTRRRRAAIVLLGAGALVLASTGAARAAAMLPDWAEMISEQAPDVPETVPDHSWRVLSDETLYVVEPDGQLSIRRRVARQALSASVGPALGAFSFDDTVELERTRAWHYIPGQWRARRRGRGDAVDVKVGDGFLSDAKARVIPVEGLEKGSLAFFEFEAKRKPYVLGFSDRFGAEVPTLHERVVVELPPGWTLAWDLPRGPKLEPEVDGRRWSFELRDIAPPEAVDVGPSAAEQRPLLLWQPVPPADAQVEPVVVPDWAGIGRWYAELSADRVGSTPELAAFADEVLPAADAPLVERIEVAARAVRDQVRYVAVHIGIGGYQPRPASETLETRWGDCKDKAALLATLLAEQGVTSHPVLVHATEEDTVSPTVPCVESFDHLVLAVELPEGEPVPESMQPALLEVDGLPPLLVIDATSEYAAIGAIGSSIAGKSALLVLPGGGRLVRLPGDRPGDHRYVARIEGRLLPNGSALVSLTVRYFGSPAVLERSTFRGSREDHVESLRSAIRDVWPGAVFDEHEAEPEIDSGAFVEHISWRVHALPGGGGKVPLFVRPHWWLPRPNVSRRELPVRYGHPREIRVTARWEGLSGDLVEPAPVEREMDGAAVRTSFVREGDAAEAELHIELGRTEFDPGEFRTLRRFTAVCRAAERTALSWRR
jgi:hypothetical protein